MGRPGPSFIARTSFLARALQKAGSAWRSPSARGRPRLPMRIPRFPLPRLSVSLTRFHDSRPGAWFMNHVSRAPLPGVQLPSLLLSGLLLAAPALAEDPSPPPAPVRRVHIPALKTGDQGSRKWVLRCDDRHTVAVQLETETHEGGSCVWRLSSQQVTVLGPQDQKWMSLERYLPELNAPLPGFDLECHGEQLQLLDGQISVPIHHNPGTEGELSVDPSLTRELEQRLSQPPRGKLAEAHRLLDLLLLVHANDRTWYLATLDAWREEFAQGDWHSASRGDEWTLHTDLPADLAIQFQRLAHQVGQAREHTQPFHAVELRQLDTRKKLFGWAPTSGANIFWRGQELCVRQMDDSKNMMRCFNTATLQGGAPEAMPDALPQSLFVRMGGCGSICDPSGDNCVSMEVSPVGSTREGELLVLEKGRWVASGLEQKRRTLSPKAVSAELAQGPGSRVLGGGHYILQEDSDRFVPIEDKDPRSWFLFDAPPPGPDTQWLGTLVSPDQQWVAALSGRSTEGPVVLWVARIVPIKAPPHP